MSANDERYSKPWSFMRSLFILSLGICLAGSPHAALLAETGSLPIEIVDQEGNPLPCRIHLKNEQGEPQFAAKLPCWDDHFVSPGCAALELKPGRYQVEIERGPEFVRLSEAVDIAAGSNQTFRRTLKRLTDLRSLGWFSGDLHVHRPVADVELLMRAEDLDFAPVITWWNNKNAWRDSQIPLSLTTRFDRHRIYNIMAGEDEREGGALLYFGLERPINLSAKSREVPSPMVFVHQARSRPGAVRVKGKRSQANAKMIWIDIEKPFWWDVPLWLASGQMDSVGIANNHMCRSQMYANEAWGKTRDEMRLPNPLGNGFWSQEIYYHILNCGLRIPPSAGSASGVLPNPVGYNRVYVHLGDEKDPKDLLNSAQGSKRDGPTAKTFQRDSWWSQLSRGRCFVTNGPILLVRANQQLSGAELVTDEKRRLNVKFDIQVVSNDPISRLELIHNGSIVKTVDGGDPMAQRLTIKHPFDAPGWFLVRAFADVEQTFRFASTAPWYLTQEGSATRVSQHSAQFFLDWVKERIGRVQSNVDSDLERQQVLDWHRQARDYWTKKVSAANAD